MLTELKTPLRQRKEVEPDSRLMSILECNPCRVNALHSQAIAEPGEGLRIVAREPNGVTQAVEHKDHPFVIGVQWHPEFMPQSEGQLAAQFIASWWDTQPRGHNAPQVFDASSAGKPLHKPTLPSAPSSGTAPRSRTH